MEKNVLKATVKKDGRKVTVYKLKDGRYNIFLGESISLSKVENKEHSETFEENELVFVEAKP